MIDRLSAGAKAAVAYLAGLTGWVTLVTSSSAGPITGAEWGALFAVHTAAVIVWLTPNKDAS